jgi:uncharacterized protein (DUF433 family)
VWVVREIIGEIMLTTQQKQEIIDKYKSGLGSDTIAKQYDIHPNTVLKILKKNGIERRGLRKKIFPEDEIKIVELYQQGLSAPQIAEQFDIEHTMVLRYLEKNGINRRSAEECHRKYAINEHFFDNIDTEEKAYFLGFLYADGGNNIDANFVRIDLARKDKDILEKLASLIYLNNPLQHIKNQDREKEYKGQKVIYHTSYFNINSKYICHKLEALGCPAKKSLIITFPEWLTDPELQKHFIRGYYDGDGGVSLTDVKTRSANTKIVSTLEFCKTMSKIIELNSNIKFGEPYNDVEEKNVYSIRLSGNRQIIHFLDWLYKNSSIHLNRKYNLYLKLLEKNKDTDKLILKGNRGYNKRYYKK